MLRITQITLFIVILISGALQAKTYHLYFMGGQSNMDGYGYIKDLPKELMRSTDKVLIFHGNTKFDNERDGGLGMWSNLQPGHGTGFKSNGIQNEYSERFGPELTFGITMAEKTGKNIAIIKYALGGSGLGIGVGFGNWAPDFNEGKGINQYDHALTTIKAAMYDHDIDNDGIKDTLIPMGIVWMQGEADAQQSIDSANAYGANLKRLMDLLRAALLTDDLPVVLGKINRSNLPGYEDQMPFIETVQKAHLEYSKTDKCAAYATDSENYKFIPTDGWHYDSEGFIKMGKAFAREMIKLNKKCKLY